MSFEVDSITHGDASKRLNVPPATLRNWADQLEEYNCHHVIRNQRNERIYYNSDIKIFEFLRDLKEEYGRRTTTKDLSYMIVDEAKEGRFELRTREDAPTPKPTNRTTELMNHTEIKQILNSDIVKQFFSVAVDERVSELKEEIRKDIREELSKSNQELSSKLEKERVERDERDRRIEEKLDKRDENLMRAMQSSMDSKKGFWSKMFGK